MGIESFNASASLNTTLGSIQVGEGMARGDVSDAIRQLMAFLAGDVLPIVSPKKFGAVGDGVADDTAAIQSALNAGSVVWFTPGKTYKVTSTLTVPTTCRYIEGTGAQLVGPGSGGTVDGFDFTAFHQGPSTYPTWHQGFKGEHYRLPSLTAFRRGISVRNAAFLPIECDIISFCADGVYIQATSGANNWAVQNIIRVGMVINCTNALELDAVAASVEGIQGSTIDIRYVSGCNVGIKGTFDGPTTNINYNIFKIGNLDGNGAVGPNVYAINFSHELTSNINTFQFENEPINMNPAAGLTAYNKIDNQEVVLSGAYIGSGFAPYHWTNFLSGGARTTARPGFGTLTIYVDQSLVTTGNGSQTSPFKTVAEAVNAILDMDGFGNAAVIQLVAGTYSEAINIDTRAKGTGNWSIQVQGVASTPASVTLTGGFTVQGTGRFTLQDVTIQTLGVNANYRANLELNRVYFAAAAGQTHISASNGALVEVQANYTISGGSAVHYGADSGGRIRAIGRTITISGTPAFSSYFALSNNGAIEATGDTFTGSATGVRYLANLLGLINTNGGGATYFPGNSAGTTTNGGVYA